MTAGVVKSRAFTILELAVAVVVIAILVGLSLPVLRNIRSRAERVQCMANLRSLYTAANLSVQQNQRWPQLSTGGDDESALQEIARLWIEELKQHGATEKTWICPTMQSQMGNPDYTQAANRRIDYTPMSFDDKPTTPHQWPGQPWFVENGDVHGNGPLIIFTDGSIKDLKTVAAEASGSPK